MTQFMVEIMTGGLVRELYREAESAEAMDFIISQGLIEKGCKVVVMNTEGVSKEVANTTLLDKNDIIMGYRKGTQLIRYAIRPIKERVFNGVRYKRDSRTGEQIALDESKAISMIRKATYLDEASIGAKTRQRQRKCLPPSYDAPIREKARQLREDMIRAENERILSIHLSDDDAAELGF